jgi:hypothetical protein
MLSPEALQEKVMGFGAKLPQVIVFSRLQLFDSVTSYNNWVEKYLERLNTGECVLKEHFLTSTDCIIVRYEYRIVREQD